MEAKREVTHTGARLPSAARSLKVSLRSRMIVRACVVLHSTMDALNNSSHQPRKVRYFVRVAKMSALRNAKPVSSSHY